MNITLNLINICNFTLNINIFRFIKEFYGYICINRDMIIKLNVIFYLEL